MQRFSDILKTKELVLVDFFATWCGPCKMMHPVLESLKKNFGDKIHILKVDIDKNANQQLVASYGVRSVPTLFLFQKGKDVWRQSGAIPLDQLKKTVETYM